MRKTILLGPQRDRPTATRVAREIEGPCAVITAGWQERENDPLPRGLNRKGTNLGVYRRFEQVLDEDRELALAHRERQLELQQLQRLYRLRLDHAISAFKEIASLPETGDPQGGEAFTREADAALEAIRALDNHHLEQVCSVHRAWEDRWQPTERPAVARQRLELTEQLDAVDWVILAGGHVAVLLNRLRLLGVAPLFETKSLVAWSAGAMVVADRIVLFHDSPPWGAGNAEVLDYGLGLVEQVLPLPDCGRRLMIHDSRRIELLARRFAPLTCVGLDPRSQLARNGGGWQGLGALHLKGSGEVRRVGRSSWEELGE